MGERFLPGRSRVTRLRSLSVEKQSKISYLCALARNRWQHKGGRQREVRNELDDLAQRIKGLALSVGFDLAGVAPAVSTPETLYLREWLAQGYGGSMGYLERRCEERVDPRKSARGSTVHCGGGPCLCRQQHRRGSGVGLYRRGVTRPDFSLRPAERIITRS